MTTTEHRDPFSNPRDSLGRLRVTATKADGLVRVLDASRRDRLPTGYVTVTAPADATDLELAVAAGFDSSHYGYTVTRHDDSTATVALWND